MLRGRIFHLIVGLALAFALIEIAGRAMFGFDPLPGWAQDFNNRVGYALRPNETYTFAGVAGGFERTVRHNSRGLHDVEHDLRKPDGVFRILILADSYGHAQEVALEDNFARRLESLLNENAPDDLAFEVINAGHFGLGTTQEYLYYTVEGRRYAPDLVLLGFYAGNDVVDNHAPLIKAWHNVETVDFPYFSPDGTLHQPGMATRRRVLSWLRHNLFTVNVIANAVTNSKPVERVEVGNPNALAGRVPRIPMGIYLEPDEVWQAAWAVTAHALASLNRAVQNDGVRLGVFIIPDRRQVYDEDWEATLSQLPDLDPAALDRERPTRTIKNLLDEQEIPALNLLDAFLKVEERAYYPLDGHFTPAGHGYVAEVLAKWLIDAELIPAPPAEATLASAAPITGNGLN